MWSDDRYGGLCIGFFYLHKLLYSNYYFFDVLLIKFLLNQQQNKTDELILVFTTYKYLLSFGYTCSLVQLKKWNLDTATHSKHQRGYSLSQATSTYASANIPEALQKNKDFSLLSILNDMKRIHRAPDDKRHS